MGKLPILAGIRPAISPGSWCRSNRPSDFSVWNASGALAQNRSASGRGRASRREVTPWLVCCCLITTVVPGCLRSKAFLYSSNSSLGNDVTMTTSLVAALPIPADTMPRRARASIPMKDRTRMMCPPDNPSKCRGGGGGAAHEGVHLVEGDAAAPALPAEAAIAGEAHAVGRDIFQGLPDQGGHLLGPFHLQVPVVHHADGDLLARDLLADGLQVHAAGGAAFEGEHVHVQLVQVGEGVLVGLVLGEEALLRRVAPAGVAPDLHQVAEAADGAVEDLHEKVHVELPHLPVASPA